jgi:hypothetical protein
MAGTKNKKENWARCVRQVPHGLLSLSLQIRVEVESRRYGSTKRADEVSTAIEQAPAYERASKKSVSITFDSSHFHPSRHARRNLAWYLKERP